MGAGDGLTYVSPELPNNDTAGLYRLPSVDLNSPPLGVGVAAVLRRACTLLVRGLNRQRRGDPGLRCCCPHMHGAAP